MKLDDWKSLRSQWVKARDAAVPPVKAGAVRGVSMGDAIEDVHKALPKGHMALGKALGHLRKALDKYQAALKARNKGLCDWLEKEVRKPMDALEDQLADDVGRLMAVRRELQSFKTRHDCDFPDGTEFHKVGLQAEKAGISWQEASRDLFKRLEKALDLWRFLTQVVHESARELSLAMPVKPDKAELNHLADYIDHEIDLVAALVKSKTLDEFQYKAKACRDSYYLLVTQAKAIEKAIDKIIP